MALNISSSIIEVEAEESPAAVILPQEALPVQGNLDAERILTVVPLTGEATKTTLGEGSKAEFGGKSVELAVDAVDVSLFEVLGGQSSAISIDDAPSPIFLRLSDQNAEPDWRCAYLDGEVWSREGVRLASAAEISALYGDSVNTSGVWCATTHLSIFGILIDTLLDCTNLNVLSQEGLEQVFHRTTWWTLLPAVSLWLLTAALLFLVLVGVAQDAKMRRAGFWRDEYFLTEVAPVSATVEMSRAMSSTSRQMSRVMSWITAERAEKSDGDVDGKVDGQRIRTLRPSLRQQLQDRRNERERESEGPGVDGSRGIGEEIKGMTERGLAAAGRRRCSVRTPCAPRRDCMACTVAPFSRTSGVRPDGCRGAWQLPGPHC